MNTDVWWFVGMCITLAFLLAVPALGYFVEVRAEFFAVAAEMIFWPAIRSWWLTAVIIWLSLGVFTAGLNNAALNHMFCSNDSIWGGRAGVSVCESNNWFILAFVVATGPITLINYYITFPDDHNGWSLAAGKSEYHKGVTP